MAPKQLVEQVQSDLKTALLGGDRFKAEVLRGLKAAILNEEVAQKKRDEGLSDEQIEKIVAREIKKRFESAALYDQNDRADTAKQERDEAQILQAYLPEQMDEAEIKTIVDAKISELGAADMKMMGHVIGAVKEEVGNKADGATISKLVKQQLG